MTAQYGLETLCVEAHDTPGGVAHSFERYSSASSTTPFRFDSGPSLLSGMSQKGTNPLRQVLDAIGTSHTIDWKTYDGWIVHDLADGKSFKLTTGDSDAFGQALELKAGIEARREFEHLRDELLQAGGLADASAGIPPLALRGDAWWRTIQTLRRFLINFLKIGTKGTLLTGPFSNVLDQYGSTNEFVRKWFDYLAFALSGLNASQTQAAPVVYTMKDLHAPGAVLDYPMGGMEALIQALVAGLEQHGGALRLNSRVEQLVFDDDKCNGVVLTNGRVIRARQGVVCNAPLWNMARLVNDSVAAATTTTFSKEQSGISSNKLQEAAATMQQQANDMCMTGSFMHLHLGIPKDGLPADLECHHSVLNFDQDVTAEQNMVIISIPTVFDPSLAPEGYHVVHAYTAACDSFDPWQTFLDSEKDSGKVEGSRPNSVAAAAYRSNPDYQALKDARAEVLWKAVECVIPDVRQRAQRDDGSVVLVGTPLTHRRYNQRFRGTYGPAPRPGRDIWELTGSKTSIDGLWACGDTCFPGIGLPGVAASGTIAANSLVSVPAQNELLDRLQSEGALQ